MPPSVCPLRYDPFGMPPSAPRSRVQKALDDLHMGPREQVAAPWALLHPLSLIPYPCAAPPLLLSVRAVLLSCWLLIEAHPPWTY